MDTSRFYNEGFAILDEGVVLNEEGIVSVGGCVVLNEEGTVSVGGDEQRDEYKEHLVCINLSANTWNWIRLFCILYHLNVIDVAF